VATVARISSSTAPAALQPHGSSNTPGAVDRPDDHGANYKSVRLKSGQLQRDRARFTKTGHRCRRWWPAVGATYLVTCLVEPGQRSKLWPGLAIFDETPWPTGVSSKMAKTTKS